MPFDQESKRIAERLADETSCESIVQRRLVRLHLGPYRFVHMCCGPKEL
jgi:hypothetical protein